MRGDAPALRQIYRIRHSLELLAVSAILLAVCIPSRVLSAPQEPEPPIPIDSTPLADLLSPNDKLEANESKDPKKVVEAYLRISGTHLDLALNTIKKNDFRSSERELDIYKKALSKAGELAFNLRDKRRSIAKKIEQTIYKQIRTLEAVQHLFPPERLPFADAALRHAKQLRVQALNVAFAAGDVLKEPGKEKKPAGDEPPNTQQAPSRLFPYKPETTMREFVVDLSRLNGAGPLVQLAGDYLTEEEDNHVREAQSPDDRTKVFMKIADRRLALITGPAPSVSTTSAKPDSEKKVDRKAQKKAQAKAEEQEREWGTLPSLSRTELLRHYVRAIVECMAKLEDAYERNPKSSALSKALGILREATDRQLTILRSLGSQGKDEAERRALAEAIDQAETANKGAHLEPDHK
jgi:hypothetical protein